jgi:hypothetical protein
VTSLGARLLRGLPGDRLRLLRRRLDRDGSLHIEAARLRRLRTRRRRALHRLRLIALLHDGGLRLIAVILRVQHLLLLCTRIAGT